MSYLDSLVLWDKLDNLSDIRIFVCYFQSHSIFGANIRSQDNQNLFLLLESHQVVSLGHELLKAINLIGLHNVTYQNLFNEFRGNDCLYLSIYLPPSFPICLFGSFKSIRRYFERVRCRK